MKLFWFCTFFPVLGLVRGIDVKCTPHNSKNTSCLINEPVTIKTGEKVNIVSDFSLNSIDELTILATKGNRPQISTVPTEIFEQLPNLEAFTLQGTVEVLNEGDFKEGNKLKHLLIENQLKTVPAGVLSSAKNLVGLFLPNNQITEIEDNAFNGLNALLYINLENNKLTIIKQNTFNGLDKLEILNLAANQIETIEENALNLPNLKKISVIDNKLTSFSDNLFSATPLLDALRANGNQINHIGKSLYGLKNLETLSLNENKPSDIDLIAISQLPALKKLYLNYIGLTSDNISKIEIKEPSTSLLSYLSLVGNELTNSDDWKKFAIFPQLERIDVLNTKYSKIDVGDKTLRQQFPKLSHVLVSSSEWSCDWLKDFVESSKKDGIDIATKGFSSTNGKEVNGIGCV